MRYPEPQKTVLFTIDGPQITEPPLASKPVTVLSNTRLRYLVGRITTVFPKLIETQVPALVLRFLVSDSAFAKLNLQRWLKSIWPPGHRA